MKFRDACGTRKVAHTMKLRESGMPDEAYWETLFDVPLILDRLGIDNRLRDGVELGCGYGTFTLPVARRISGTLRTYDIDADMVERTVRRAGAEGIGNIFCEQRDVFLHGFGIAPESQQDACLLFNILHCEEPLRFLREAVHVARPTGFVHVIHWRYDPATPRGPSMEIRPRPEQIVEWGMQAGLTAARSSVMDLPPWHYGIRFHRP
jgi:SAM-dependent methyltransferase